MDNYKNYEFYVKKIIEDIEFVIENSKGLTCDEFEDDVL